MSVVTVPAGYRLPGDHHRYPYGYGPGYGSYRRNLYHVGTTEDLDPSLPPLQGPAEYLTLPSSIDIVTTTATIANKTTVNSSAVNMNSTTTPNNYIATSFNSTSTEVSTVNATDLKSASVDLKSASVDLVETELGPPPMIIPINGLDLIALLSKLRSENRNYSLQIVTT